MKDGISWTKIAILLAESALNIALDRVATKGYTQPSFSSLRIIR
jgi:hypothetical protein